MNQYNDKADIKRKINTSNYIFPVFTITLLIIAAILYLPKASGPKSKQSPIKNQDLQSITSQDSKTDISTATESNQNELQTLNTEAKKISKSSKQEDRQKNKNAKSVVSSKTTESKKAEPSPSRIASGKLRKFDELQNEENINLVENTQNQSPSIDDTKIKLDQKDFEINNLSIAATTSADGFLEPKADKGNPLRIGNMLLKPSLRIKYGHDDNVNRAPDIREKVSSAVVKTAVGLAADLEHKGDTYRLAYEGELTRYFSSNIDNTTMHKLNLQGLNILNSRNSVKWNAGLLQSADPRGSTDATLNQTSPSEYRQKNLKGTYIYGVEGSRGRLEVDAFGTNKRYLNNRETMDKADVDSLGLAGRFFWRIMPKTSAFLDLRHTEYEYKESTALLDSKENSYLAGLTWNTTAATTGSLRIGHTTRDYKERSDFSGLSWETGVTWKPLTYSIFNFSAMRNVSDTVAGTSSNVGNYILNSTYEARWNHEWRHNLNSSLGWRHIQSDYEGIDRKDTQDVISADLYYKFRPQVDIGLEMNWTDRRSNLDQFDYDRLLLMGVVEFKY